MPRRQKTAAQQHRDAVAAYVAAGGEESVQRVITAVYGVTKKLDQWYARQLADLDLTQGEWAVVAALAKAGEECLTPSQLAELTSVAPSSMTHRLDKMTERGLVQRRPDADNRTRTLVSLTPDGWELFTQSIRESDVVESDVLRGLSATERRELARLLEDVITHLDDVEA
ncbi:MarR family winged helix-turn-helix transcriptional regulator [Knoellia subterranea]|uniref:MarR family transcriptional regulator n=1 Tax=Knoellia subterranea KCTC 19937 TaxID=1385521 RepID=A0A0A0JST7_9MICO|nr:MarR family transcriptional regulator [Knoellia subterranea]KGN38696.1 MarR family transcriptional regulator [Knoellia subterranea KCTC 19937]